MHLEKVRTTDVPGGKRKITGIVRYDDGEAEEYWFTLPDHVKVTSSGNPWVAVLLPLAAYTGQDIRIDLPVDPYLLHNAECLISLWRVWHPGRTKAVRVLAEAAPIDERPEDILSAFTAGVDSFFTVLRHPECKRYVNVLGLDMPLTNEPSFGRLLARLSMAAAELGATIIPMSTNLRETRWGGIPWESFASGGALAGSFLFLEREFGKILIPSSFDFRSLFPYGTHPLSDPFYSTSRTQIIHDGISHTRAAKTEFVIKHQVVLDNLHVCFQGQDARGQDDTNCCACSKCYRTMIVLDILGKLKDCALFDHRKFDRDKIGRLDTSSAVAESFFTDVRTLALEHGMLDIVAQIDRSFTRSRWVSRFDWMAYMPFLWRVPQRLRKHAFSGFATLNRARRSA